MVSALVSAAAALMSLTNVDGLPQLLMPDGVQYEMARKPKPLGPLVPPLGPPPSLCFCWMPVNEADMDVQLPRLGPDGLLPWVIAPQPLEYWDVVAPHYWLWTTPDRDEIARE